MTSQARRATRCRYWQLANRREVSRSMGSSTPCVEKPWRRGADAGSATGWSAPGAGSGWMVGSCWLCWFMDHLEDRTAIGRTTLYPPRYSTKPSLSGFDYCFCSTSYLKLAEYAGDMVAHRLW